MSSSNPLTPSDVLKGSSPASPAAQKGEPHLSSFHCFLVDVQDGTRPKYDPCPFVIGFGRLLLEATAIWRGTTSTLRGGLEWSPCCATQTHLRRYTRLHLLREPSMFAKTEAKQESKLSKNHMKSSHRQSTTTTMSVQVLLLNCTELV